MTGLNDLIVGQKVEIMIDDEIFIGTVYDKSTRETRVETATHYTLNVDNTDWSISLSRNIKKRIVNNADS